MDRLNGAAQSQELLYSRSLRSFDGQFSLLKPKCLRRAQSNFGTRIRLRIVRCWAIHFGLKFASHLTEHEPRWTSFAKKQEFRMG